jgi:SAM-dependent methyltransferase
VASSGGDAQRIAGHIIAVARALGRSTPAPRDHPYFGLDAPSPPPVALLERLTAAGIFRKYEYVLAIGSGLGAIARWLARSRGCRVVGITDGAAAARGARLLTLRAGLDDQVDTVTAAARRLPVRTETFTHVWYIDSIGGAPPAERVATLREAHRALRGGGLFAALETVAAPPGSEPAAPRPDDDGVVRRPDGQPLASVATCIDTLVAAGFTDVRCEDASALVPLGPDPFDDARARLLARIAEREGAHCGYVRAHHAAARLAAATREGRARTYLFFAGRGGGRSAAAVGAS